MRIVAFAYACEPATGSESGAGWIWSRMLARLGSAWVITRANNREDIENLLPHIPERDRLNFVYVDLPQWARFWKKGKRGARLYYMLWQAAALVEARRLHKEIGFDLAWHLTFSTVWLGSAGSLLGTPFVYGPVGGGVGCPWRLSSTLGGLGVAYEVLRSSARGVGRYLNPWARLAWNKADLILTQNEETRTWFPKRHRRRVVVFPHIVLDEPLAMLDVDRSRAARTPTKTALFAGRLLPWKGTALALHVMDRLPDWRLIICGRGADERRLRRLARRLQIEERVEFRGQISRDELMRLMKHESDVFLFPSLHDEGGWVIVESLAAGLPVVCLARGGPPALGGWGVPVGNVSETIQGLVDRVQRIGTRRDEAEIPAIDDASIRLETLLEEHLPWVMRERVARG